MNATWQSASVSHVPGSGYESRTKLQRRHTIMVCESPTDAKLALQELPPLEEEEEPSPSEEQTPRLQRGADSTLSGLPDHTLHNGVLLRNAGGGGGGGAAAARHQGLLYRSEHRRSLTSGLTVIPEDEDATEGGGSGCDNLASVPNRRHSLPASTHSMDMTSHGQSVGGAKVSSVVGRGGGGGRGISGGVASVHITKKDVHSSGRAKTHSQRMHVHSSEASGGDRGAVAEDEERKELGDLALLNTSEMLHKRWQNPIECLSLTLEEVTHIRSVLTKAELESLISHPDLYNQVAKRKVCFTCKTTRFTLFGEWGTKCKFCKRTVCSKCMRKMHVPTEHFKNIPVYTLSPTPLTKEAQELIQNYVKTSPPASAPASSLQSSQRNKSLLDQQKGKRPLKRSQSMTLPTKKDAAIAASSGAASSCGPLMSICCDCKGMIMEIIRASKTSLAMLQPSQTDSAGSPDSASSMSFSSPSTSSPSAPSSPSSNC